MPSKDLISVIIPVHNGEDYLENCVDSILSQACSVFDLEIIIINDGSTDDTAAICEKINSVHDFIQIIEMEDLGVSCGRNAGLEKAKGDFLCFVDADDRLLPGALKYMYELVTGEDFTFAGVDFKLWDAENEYLKLLAEKNDLLLSNPKIYTGNEYIDKGILAGDTRCWAKLYRTSHIKNIRFKEGLSIGEDMLFLLAVLFIAPRIIISDFPGYAYYKNLKGATLRPFKPEYMDQIACWQEADEKIGKLRPDLRYRVAANIMISIMLTVGKIAILPKKIVGIYQDKIIYCHEQLLNIRKVQGAYGELSNGYKIKIRLFNISPRLYICVYGFWKSRNQ